MTTTAMRWSKCDHGFKKGDRVIHDGHGPGEVQWFAMYSYNPVVQYDSGARVEHLPSEITKTP